MKRSVWLPMISFLVFCCYGSMIESSGVATADSLMLDELPKFSQGIIKPDGKTVLLRDTESNVENQAQKIFQHLQSNPQNIQSTLNALLEEKKYDEYGALLQAAKDSQAVQILLTAESIHKDLVLLWVRDTTLEPLQALCALQKKVGESVISVDICGKDGATPLIIASLNGSKAMVQLLLEHGANVNAQDDEGNTALNVASWKGYLEVVQVLLEHKAEVNLKDNNDGSPLSDACCNGHKVIVEKLLAKKASVNEQDKKGNTPLMWAAGCGHTEIVKQLLNHGADGELADTKGLTALMWTAKTGRKECVELLLQRAKTDVEDAYGHTALWWAAKNGHQDIVSLFEKSIGSHE